MYVNMRRLICKNCNNEVDDNFKMCPRCGIIFDIKTVNDTLIKTNIYCGTIAF